jgi:hypothetical protein
MTSKAKRDLASRYRRLGESILIEMKLNNLMQLFNSLDPAPFHEKDLDDDAADYIVSTARDFPLKTPMQMEIYLPAAVLQKESERSITQAIHNFFDYKTQAKERELRVILREGRVSLLIGLLFLSVCLFARELLGGWVSGTANEVLREGLLISGWVAIWRPIQLFLYDWWPIWNLRRLYYKLSHLHIDVRTLGT